jgi:hypothetical protein
MPASDEKVASSAKPPCLSPMSISIISASRPVSDEPWGTLGGA